MKKPCMECGKIIGTWNGIDCGNCRKRICDAHTIRIGYNNELLCLMCGEKKIRERLTELKDNLICNICGTKLPINASYCLRCGEKTKMAKFRESKANKQNGKKTMHKLRNLGWMVRQE